MHSQLNYGTPDPQWGGMGGQITKQPFLRGGRRRLNLVPILLSLFVPWILFSFSFYVAAFWIHYDNPTLYYFLEGCAFVLVLAVVAPAVSSRVRWFSQAESSPSWLIFLSVNLFVAWAVGLEMGDMTYQVHMQPYFDMHNLNNYTHVYPNRMRGQQLMDAGSITFTEGTKLDVTKSMGFKNNQIYCVAPISYGAMPPATYDFWAVGTNCCSGNQADFHCTGFSSPNANGGLRLMSDGDRAFYRLAVQQAEAAYKIKAVHPLFFRWVEDPLETVDSWKQKGQSQFLVWIFSAFVFQVFIVGFATLLFSKIGTNN